MLLLTYANLETYFSGMIVPRRAQWSKKVRARQQMTVPMARGHGLKKGLTITTISATTAGMVYTV